MLCAIAPEKIVQFKESFINILSFSQNDAWRTSRASIWIIILSLFFKFAGTLLLAFRLWCPLSPYALLGMGLHVTHWLLPSQPTDVTYSLSASNMHRTHTAPSPTSVPPSEEAECCLSLRKFQLNTPSKWEGMSGILPGPQSYITCREIDLVVYNVRVNPCLWKSI